MKKFLSMIAAVVAVFTFAACGGDETAEVKLTAPAIKSVVATEAGDGFTVTWNAVKGATGYVVMIQGQTKTYSTKETSYTFTNLTFGTYTPMVKAVSASSESTFSKGQSVTIKGVSSVDWFTQSLSLPTDNEENAAKCINSSNTILITWKGTDVDSIATALYYAKEGQDLDSVTYDEVAADLGSADKFLADINSKGVTVVFDDLDGNTDWVVFTYVTNKEGQEFFTYNTIKTNPTIPTIASQAWLGTWEARTNQLYTFATKENGLEEDILEDKTTDFTLTIEPDETMSSRVWIGGLSSVFSVEDGIYALADTALGENGEIMLGVINSVGVAQLEGGSYAIWLTYVNIEENGKSFDTFLSGDFYSTYFVKEGDDITCMMGSGYLDENKTVPYEVLFIDVFQATPTADGQSMSIGIYGEEFRYGEIELLNKTAEYQPAAQALNANNFSFPAAIPTSMVVR